MTNDLLPANPQARAILAALDTLQQSGICADLTTEVDSYRITLPPVRALFEAVATLRQAGIDATLDTRTGLPIQITLRPAEPAIELADAVMAAQVHRLQTLQAAHVVTQAKLGRQA